MPYVTTLSYYRQTTPQDFRSTFLYFYGMQEQAPVETRHNINFRHTLTRWFDPELVHEPPYYVAEVRTLSGYIEAFKIRNPDPERWYETFFIPKASGGMRSIDAPIQELKELQRRIVTALSTKPGNSSFQIVHAHDCAYAYIRGRSTKDALIEHQHNGSHWYLKLDIRDFFPSCNRTNLTRNLKEIYPLCYLPDDLLQSILDVCLWHDTLPQGAVTSPLLSNLVLLPFDKAMSDWLFNLNRHHYVYTRYADDILISMRETFEWRKIQQRTAELLQSFGPFHLKTEKTRYASNAGRNWNLGLMLNQENQITTGHRNKARLRAAVFNFLKDFDTANQWTPEDTQVLQGQLAYLDAIEPGAKLHLVHKMEAKTQRRFQNCVRAILNP